MGRQTKKDHRTSSLTRKQGTRNVKQSFLIVCEEVRTEPDYFISNGNPAMEESSTTVRLLVEELNKYV